MWQHGGSGKIKRNSQRNNLNGFQSIVYVVNGLTDMYAKCANIDKAKKIFDEMTERIVI